MTTRRTIRRTLFITLGTIVVLLAAAFVLVHTSVFEGYLRGKIVQAAREKLGSPVEIRSLSIAWDQLAVEMHGLTIRGRGYSPQPPLLQIRRLRVGVNAAALLSRRLQLSQVILDQPVLRISVDPQGQTNFPAPKPTGRSPSSKSSTVDSLFNLAIHHMQIKQGTIYYKDAKIPLSADLTDLGANVFFNRLLGQYEGSVGYKNGRIEAKSFDRITNSASLQFAASRSGIRCDPLSVALPESRASLYATVEDYSNPHVSGRYTAEISTAEVAQALHETSLPMGSVSASGTIDYQSTQGRTFLESVRLDGTLFSPELAVQLRQFTAPVKTLRANYSIEGGTVKIANVRADALGGKLTVPSGEIALTGNQLSHLSATLVAASLTDVSRALPSGPYDRLSLSGDADVGARLSWSGNFRDLVIDADAKLYANSGQRLAPGAIPLSGVIQISYNKALGRASLGNSQVRIGETTVSAAGVLSKRSDMVLTVSTGDLHQLSEFATAIVAAGRSRGSTPLRLPKIDGTARFTGRAYGALQNPQVTGHLIARNLQLESTRWSMIETDLALSPSRAALSNGVMIVQTGGRIRLAGAVQLRRWSLTPSSGVSLHANATGLQISQIETLAHKEYPVSGTASAEVSVGGTRDRPTGQGWIRIMNASAWNQPLSLFSVSFHGDAAALHLDLSAAATAGTISGGVTYDSLHQRYQASVHTSGIQLASLEMVRAQHLPLNGTLIVTANGTGSIASPQLSAAVEIPQLAFRGEKVSDFRSQLDVSNRQLRYTANASLYGGKLNSQGQVLLAGVYETSATLDVRSISVGTLASRFTYNGEAAPQGQIDLHLAAQGPLKDTAEMSVRAEVPAMAVTYQSVRLSLVRPLVLNYRDGSATVESTEVKGGGIDLSFGGVIPVKSSRPFRLDARGTANLAMVQAMTPGFQCSGNLKIDIAAQGTLAQPDMQGHLSFEKVSFSSDSFPVDVSRMNGTIRVSGRRMEIVSLTGSVNGGDMKAQGSTDLGKNSVFDLAVAAKSVNINYPSGVRARLDGDLRLNGSAAASALTGRVVIDYLGFTQQMDIATLAGEFSSSEGISTPSPFERHTKLSIAIQSSSTLSLASSQLSVQGAANLNVVGTLADPIVLGRATLTRGELFFMGKRYDVTRGTIEFANPTQTRPSVDLYATTTVSHYKISMHFLGPVDEMKTTFTSTPTLPQADIINLLAFGQTTEQATTSPTPGSLGAESVLAQGIASQLSGKIQKLAGISQLSITPVIAANGVQQPGPGAQVAIQQRVSGRLLVTFTTDTAQTQATTVQVQYRLGHGLSVSALRDQNGGYGIDLHLHKSF